MYGTFSLSWLNWIFLLCSIAILHVLVWPELGGGIFAILLIIVSVISLVLVATGLAYSVWILTAENDFASRFFFNVFAPLLALGITYVALEINKVNWTVETTEVVETDPASDTKTVYVFHHSADQADQVTPTQPQQSASKDLYNFSDMFNSVADVNTQESTKSEKKNLHDRFTIERKHSFNLSFMNDLDQNRLSEVLLGYPPIQRRELIERIEKLDASIAVIPDSAVKEGFNLSKSIYETHRWEAYFSFSSLDIIKDKILVVNENLYKAKDYIQKIDSLSRIADKIHYDKVYPKPVKEVLLSAYQIHTLEEIKRPKEAFEYIVEHLSYTDELLRMKRDHLLKDPNSIAPIFNTRTTNEFVRYAEKERALISKAELAYSRARSKLYDTDEGFIYWYKNYYIYRGRSASNHYKTRKVKTQSNSSARAYHDSSGSKVIINR